MRRTLRTVPAHIARPDYSGISSCAVPHHTGFPSLLTSNEDIENLRSACKAAATIRQYATQIISPGISTNEIDRALHEKIVSMGAYPSALGYAGFPKSVVTSVNNIMVHGIPDDQTILREGDILSLDVVLFKNGFHGDCCGNFKVGDVDENAKKLIEISELTTKSAIDICAPGVPISNIAEVIT
jgi:methionyl aminopeptidase